MKERESVTSRRIVICRGWFGDEETTIFRHLGKPVDSNGLAWIFGLKHHHHDLEILCEIGREFSH